MTEQRLETTILAGDDSRPRAKLTGPKAAIVMPQGKIAGGERILLELLAEIAQGSVVVCCPRGSPLGHGVERLGHHLRHFELPKLSNSASKLKFTRDYLAALSSLRRTVRAEEIAVVHSFVAFTSKVVAPVAILTGTPALLSVHEITTARSIGWWRSRLQRAFGEIGFAKVTAVSRYVASSLVCAGYSADRIVVLHNGITRSAPPRERHTARSEIGLPADSLVFLLVGRITHWKGHRVALEAFALFREAHPEVDARLAFVGDAFEPADVEYRERLEREVVARRLGEQVCFYGNRPDVETFYDASDVVLVPSTEPDPFPTVVLEAGLSARPVIVTELGGGREAVSDGVTGLVATPTPQSLAAAMERSLDHRWCERAGRAAREHVQKEFSRERFAEGVVALWDELAAPQAAGRRGLPRTLRR